jgi:nucleotide-binding universal stress UspA family protein
MAETESSKPTAGPTYEIVVGLDFSELGERAVLDAIDLAKERGHGELHVIVVGDARGDDIVLPGSDEPLSEEVAQEKARQSVEALVKRYQEERGEVPLEKVAVYVAPGSPAEQIVSLADAVNAEVVVVGTHGRTGAKRLFLGSVAEAVVRTAPCNVVVLKPKDFLEGKPVPHIQPPLAPGHSPLRRHHPVYHYVDRQTSGRTSVMPAG